LRDLLLPEGGIGEAHARQVRQEGQHGVVQVLQEEEEVGREGVVDVAVQVEHLEGSERH
jgi:hypothetical protein